MNIEFIRFTTPDGVELQGWYSDTPGSTVVIHIHGKSGNGYENNFLDDLRIHYSTQGVSFFTLDTRGRGVMSWFHQDAKLDTYGESTKKGGSAFEVFEESIHDIAGAISFVTNRGKSAVILQGHSVGCSKVVYYVTSQHDVAVKKTILLAPTDMASWGRLDPEYHSILHKAHALIDQGKPFELLGASVGLDADPMSAISYVHSYEEGGPVDIYNRTIGTHLGKVTLPMLIVYGTDDIGIIEIDKSIDNWKERVRPLLSPNANIVTIANAPHSFSGYERQLCDSIADFATKS